jgi:type VI secretion system protein ImpK
MAIDVIDELTRDCFGAIIQLRRLGATGSPDPQMLHTRLCWFVDRMIQWGREGQVPQEDLGDLVYAIVALADEVALAIPSVQQFWMYNLLQLRYFNENLAGENFFRRLETLRADPRRYAILRVYYVCLLFGFQGRYRVRGGDVELAQLTETLRLDLARHKFIEEETLSPHGGRPQEAGVGVRNSLPVLWMALGAVGVAIAINFALHVSLGSRTTDVVERIAELAKHKAVR